MTMTITVTASRTFWGTFRQMIPHWFSGPSSYLYTLVIVGIFTYVNYEPAPLWMAALTGVVWLAIMLPLMFALQAWKVMTAVRRMGLPVFCFDHEGISARSGEIHTRVPWSGVDRVRLVGRTCFFYLTPRAAWFFGRIDLAPGDLETVLGFARAANVKLQGA